MTVKGGGCSGFQYEWGTTDKEPTVENMWLDPMAEMFVFGCTIDYVSELGGSIQKWLIPMLLQVAAVVKVLLFRAFQ